MIPMDHSMKVVFEHVSACLSMSSLFMCACLLTLFSFCLRSNMLYPKEDN